MRVHKIKIKFKLWMLILLGMLFVTACDLALSATSQPVATVENTPVSTIEVFPSNTAASLVTPAPISTATIRVDATPAPVETILPVETELDPVNWMSWPVVPSITQHVREIYALGQSLGNDPRGFSVFGDCQSVFDIFLGKYIADPEKFAGLPADLQETFLYFKDSMNRESPTVKNGTTSGALLWVEWHENKYGCSDDEKPMDCELRLHNPSFVLIMVGTHSEGGRDDFYMRKILDALLARGIVPILSTKADNHEEDNHVNLETARLAAEYDIPLWNFWPVTADLPNRGLYTKKIDRHLGDIYLTEDALELHRYSALQVLDAVWRAVKDQ